MDISITTLAINPLDKLSRIAEFKFGLQLDSLVNTPGHDLQKSHHNHGDLEEEKVKGTDIMKNRNGQD